MMSTEEGLNGLALNDFCCKHSGKFVPFEALVLVVLEGPILNGEFLAWIPPFPDRLALPPPRRPFPFSLSAHKDLTSGPA
jgi:hypothetical protein